MTIQIRFMTRILDDDVKQNEIRIPARGDPQQHDWDHENSETRA